jgi:enoyl-CoA hydratase/carnithine racemase
VPSASPSPAAPATAPRGASKIDPETEAKFLAAHASAISSLPSTAQLQKLTDTEVHFTPTQVIAAANEIGHISEMVEAHPELSARGLQFYKECAEKDSAESLRATCLSDFKELQNRSGISGPLPSVPRRVALLAEKLSS